MRVRVGDGEGEGYCEGERVGVQVCSDVATDGLELELKLS